MSFFRELQRRNVFRVAAAYVVTGWLLIEIGNTLEETLRLPEWADTLLAFFLILGFPLALFFAWAYELTPEGLKRDSEVAAEDPGRVLAGRRWDRLIIVVLVLAVGYFALDKYVFETDGPAIAEEAPISAAVEGIEEVTETPGTALPPSVPAKSIAVLPFVNMSSDPEQEYFSDGLTEELLNLLAGIQDLKVAARTSSFFYKDKLDDIPLLEIARQLEVAHVLEGSVRKGGDKIRITAQLIKADDGFHLWSETYDRTLDDIFAIQDEIAAAVVGELKVTLLGEAPHATVIDPASYEKSLEGRFLFNRRAEGDLERALELFEEAAELDPNNADAWVGMAPLYIWMFDPPRIADSRAAAEKALELEPDNPEALVRYARVLNWEGRQDEGWAYYEKALEEGPDNPLVLGVWAGIAGIAGDLEGVIDFQRRAVEADPLHITNLGNLGVYLIWAGRLDEAEVYARKIKDLAPTADAWPKVLAAVRLLQGDFEAARDLMGRLQSSQFGSTGNNPLRLQAMLEFSLGNQAASDAALLEFTDTEGGNWPTDVAGIHAWRGEHDQAFAWLERALEQDPDLPRQYSWSPFLKNLHDDPRWDELMQRWKGVNWADRYRARKR